MFKISIKVIVASLILFSTPLKAVEIPKSNLLVSNKIGKIKLFHEDKNFYAVKNGEYIQIQNAYVDKEIRNLSSVELGYFLGNIKEIEVNGTLITLYKTTKDQFIELVEPNIGEASAFALDEETMAYLNSYNSIAIKELSNGEYCLRAHVNGHGGGPVFGLITYWAIKTFAYGTIAAGVTTATVATGGVAGAAIGGGAVAATAGVGTGAAIAGGAIAGAGLATEAAVATTGAVTLAGGVAATVAAIESTATGAGVFVTCIPWLP